MKFGLSGHREQSLNSTRIRALSKGAPCFPGINEYSKLQQIVKSGWPRSIYEKLPLQRKENVDTKMLSVTP